MSRQSRDIEGEVCTGEGEVQWDDDHDDWDDVIPEDLQGNADAPDDERDPAVAPEPEKTNFFGGAPIPPREKANQTDEDKKVRAESMKILANVGNFGLFFLIALVFGYHIGKWSDKLFGTKPVFTVIWIGFAVAASIRELYRNIKAAKALGDKSDGESTASSDGKREAAAADSGAERDGEAAEREAAAADSGAERDGEAAEREAAAAAKEDLQ